jgi:hypothetical protein
LSSLFLIGISCITNSTSDGRPNIITVKINDSLFSANLVKGSAYFWNECSGYLGNKLLVIGMYQSANTDTFYLAKRYESHGDNYIRLEDNYHRTDSGKIIVTNKNGWRETGMFHCNIIANAETLKLTEGYYDVYFVPQR